MNKNDPPRKALGRGLHSLLPSRGPASPTPPVAATHSTPPVTSGPLVVPVASIAPNPDQPRRDFDEHTLMELAASFERDGVIQPLLVREVAPNSYQIIAGERRWRAA